MAESDEDLQGLPESPEPRGIDFDEPAREPRPASAPIRSFTWFVVGILAAGVVLLVIAMVNNVAHFLG